MTKLRQDVLAHAEQTMRSGEALSPTKISQTLGLFDHTVAIRVIKDLRKMGRLP
jgi:hypothetical protein